MDDIQFAFTVSDRIGRLYQNAKQFSADMPVLALPYLRGLASALCDSLDREFRTDDLLEGKIKSLDSRGLLRPPMRRNLRTLQRSGNIAAHPEAFDFETHDFNALAREALVVARELIEQLYSLRGEAVPLYEVSGVDGNGLQAMCYKAMIEGDLEATHQAAKYFKAKADQLNQSELVLLSNGYGYQARPYIEQSMFWFKRGAAERQPDCMYQYGAYLVGDRESDDGLKGEGWRLIDHAADAGHADAQVHVADNLMRGLGPYMMDLKAAREMYERAADQGHPVAFGQLGAIYDQGLGCEPDATIAARYTMRAAEAGYPQGQYNLFALYHKGAGVEQNLDEALKWLAEAAEQDYPEAVFKLATLILEGRVSRSNDDEGLQLLMRATAFPELQPKAALALAEYCLRDDNQLLRLEALTNLQVAYESLTKKGDPERLMTKCLDLSFRVIIKARAHINNNGPDQALNGNDLMACSLFDADGVPTADRFARLGQFNDSLMLAVSGDLHGMVNAVAGVMQLAGVAPVGRQVSQVPSEAIRRIVSVRTEVKTGRNDLCHCGSGKKFKKCHG
ncbi:SEC-C metal-binding domain-containing protein [Pseudomonas sp.]|uniref:SEC-C metal-binding domain-containing protein n=1 Tax=Pseudomonas sp. TaxID=306 RepID=UPI00290BA5D7|nr:SEC-C metal-binding domain-containing protein [Pseudomonas sp.]MDU4251933.1 SEC-C metal-binding domain-containing protein [Pseudomonas sp.]